MKFGIFTLATKSDHQKAIGMALSARVSNPGVPLAVACHKDVMDLLRPYYDFVIQEDDGLKGFRHKVHLDRYSPFEVTFFFDSDIFIFRDLSDIVKSWSNQPYTATGYYAVDGFSSFHLDRAAVLKKIAKEKMVVIDGAGHALFLKPQCFEIFDFAREVTNKHKEYCGEISYADEDVIDIVMTVKNLAPAPYNDFFSRYATAVPGTLKMDVTRGMCEMIAQHTGEIMRPYMMHFAANEAPFPYAWQLFKLFRKNRVSTRGLLWFAVSKSWRYRFYWPLKKQVKALLK